MMNQFRVERNRHGNMYIFVRDVPYGAQMLERCVCLRQFNQKRNRYD